MDLSAPGKEQHILVPSTSETDQGPGPQFSPDGKKLAYMSDRSGTMEIWVSEQDGSNPFQLTAVGNAGTPRWSPDSKAIVFDAMGRSGSAIYAVNLQGGASRLLAPGDSSNVCPSWSRDGKWIYFASHRTGDQDPLFQPRNLASPGGRWVERLLSPLLRPFTWASWSVVEQGIVFAGPSGKGKPVISLFDFAKHRVTNVGVLDVVPFWLGATRDGKTVVFDQPGWEQAQIMLVENFR